MFNTDKKFRLGIYEKAMPFELSWEERLTKAKEAGIDFVEISIDESDDRLARLDWSDDEIYALRRLGEELEMPPQVSLLPDSVFAATEH